MEAQQVVKKNILGVGVSDTMTKNVLEYIGTVVENKKKKCFIATPNPEIVVYAHHHKEYQKLINKADIALCDGVGLMLASRLLGSELKERITGVDLMKSLCEKANEKAYSIGFLGGRDGVAERTAECLRKIYPSLNIVLIKEEWEGENKAFVDRQSLNDGESKKAPLSKIGDSLMHIDILFVAFGFPKQEKWIAENLPHIPVTIAMGVGGAFDYLSGDVPRAPFFVRAIGLEWLFRLIRQPWRWKRQLALVEFIYLILREKLRK